MNLEDNLTLDRYENSARGQFADIQSTLKRMRDRYHTKMEGRTSGGMIGSLIGTFVWLAVFIIGAVILRGMVNQAILVLCMVILLALFAFMIIDTVMDFSYYGRIAAYDAEVSDMERTVQNGLNSIGDKQREFKNAIKKGWNYFLSPVGSIPDRAETIDSTVSGMETLKKGFVHGAKNVLYFASAVAVAIVGCTALFPLCGRCIEQIIEESIGDSTLLVLNIIALVLIVIGEIILAKIVWSNTDCSVTNVTVFALLASPIAFIILVAAVSLIVKLVIWLVSILLAVLAVVAVIATVYGMLCGG